MTYPEIEVNEEKIVLKIIMNYDIKILLVNIFGSNLECLKHSLICIFEFSNQKTSFIFNCYEIKHYPTITVIHLSCIHFEAFQSFPPLFFCFNFPLFDVSLYNKDPMLSCCHYQLVFTAPNNEH